MTSNIYFFLSSFLLCNFLSGSVTVERWINEQGLIWNTWEKLQLKTICAFIKVWCLPVAATAQCPAAEPSRTPASWAKKMTCMFASCAWEQSWTTRYWWWQSKIGGVHTHSDMRCVCVYLHVLRCLLTTSCSVLLFFTQYGFNMVMSHAHAVNEIALSLNNKNSRWELRPSFPREAGLGQTIEETLQPVHLIGLYFFMRLSFSVKSEIRGAHTGCSRNVYWRKISGKPQGLITS